MLSGTFTDTKPSSPIPGTYLGYPEDMDDWSCYQLQTYFNDNKKALGRDQALSILDTDLNNMSTLSFNTPAFSCKYDCSFRKWAKTEGITFFDNILSNAYCGADSVVEAAQGAAEGVATLFNPKLITFAAIAVGGVLLYKYSKK